MALGILAAAALMLFPEIVGDPSQLTADDLATTVYFDYGSDTLGSAGEALVADRASLALLAGFERATVTGHADKAGPTGQNYRTGLARAEAVAEALVEAGFSRGAISVESAGETDPAIDHEDERREPRNRRAEIDFSR